MYTVHIYIRYIAYIYLYDKWTYLKDSMEISGSGRPKRNILQSPPPSLPSKKSLAAQISKENSNFSWKEYESPAGGPL